MKLNLRHTQLRIFTLICLPLLSAGCGMTFPMTSFLDKGDVEKTGSIISSSVSNSTDEKLSGLEDEDWRRAKSALTLALDPQGPGTVVKWDNPDSGRKGSFIPSGVPFVESNEICRSFQAEFIEKSGISQIYEGKSCRPSGEDWVIKRLEKKKNVTLSANSNTPSSNKEKVSAPLQLSP